MATLPNFVSEYQVNRPDEHPVAPPPPPKRDGGYPDGNPKTTYGEKKPGFDAIPPSALLHLGAAMNNGKEKYGAMNWRHSEVSATVYYNAALRHLLAWFDGEEYAEDSGVHHLAHVMACMSILLDAREQSTLNDNRPNPGYFNIALILQTKD